MKDDTIGAAFGVVAVWPAALSVFAGLFVLAWQALHWLNTAVWPGLTLRDGLDWWSEGVVSGDVRTGALGLEKIWLGRSMVLRWCSG